MKICIIGCGRVGLPLGLALEEVGFDVVGYDLSDDVRRQVNARREIPFHEPGFSLENSSFGIYGSLNSLLEFNTIDTYIITVGTPLGQNIESDMSNIKSVIDDLIYYDQIYEKNLILRSTISPGTSEFIKRYISEKAKIQSFNYSFSFCPERLSEGKAKKELYELPQIIGCTDGMSFEEAKDIFSKFNIDIIPMSEKEAELAKLFCNIYRYIDFAIPNYLSYIAEYFGVQNIHSFLDDIKFKYPRMQNMALPGFTKGTCLVKDWGFINESFPQTDIILQAYKINEYMPKFCVDLVDEKYKIFMRNVGVLGYTMKGDSDDMRDSLVPKMLRYIEKKVPRKVFISDYNLSDGLVKDDFENYEFRNLSEAFTIKQSEIVFIGTNHSKYKGLAHLFKGKIVVDIWGIINKDSIVEFKE